MNIFRAGGLSVANESTHSLTRATSRFASLNKPFSRPDNQGCAGQRELLHKLHRRLGYIFLVTHSIALRCGIALAANRTSLATGRASAAVLPQRVDRCA